MLSNLCMHHGCSDRAVSVKTAGKEAEEGRIKSYLALTDSILGVIKCCPTSITKSPIEKEALVKVTGCKHRSLFCVNLQ